MSATGTGSLRRRPPSASRAARGPARSATRPRATSRSSATSGSVAGQSATMTIEAVPAPTGLAAVLGDHQVALSWNAVPSGLGVTSYRVYRADASIGPWSQIATTSAVPSPSYTDATALNGHTYYYQVSAYGPGTNESAPSGTATAVLPQKLGSLAGLRPGDRRRRPVVHRLGDRDRRQRRDVPADRERLSDGRRPRNTGPDYVADRRRVGERFVHLLG